MASNPKANAPLPFTPKQSKKKPAPMQNELRDRWHKKHPDTVYARGEFYRYENGIWQPLNKHIQRREVEEILIASSKVEKIRVTATLVTNISDLSKDKCAVRDDIFDRRPDHLVCANGTLCIPKMQLRAHSKRLFATVGESYDYDPNAKCPAWMILVDYLRDTLSQQCVDWLQEFVGLSATTDMRYDVACWLYGKPGGGKSTFIAGVKAALSNRTVELGLSEIGRPFALAGLPGKTLAIATEQPCDFLKSSDLINRIISGDTVRVEQKYKDSYDYNPTVKILWGMNELPRVQSVNNGIFRRVNIFVLPKIEKQDNTIRERVKSEGPGILNWAMEGLQRLNQRGYFITPKEVTQAVNDFRENNDIPLMFLRDKYQDFDIDITFRLAASALYNDYKEWCLETGHRPKSSTLIARDWNRLELYSKRGTSGIEWYGPKYTP